MKFKTKTARLQSVAKAYRKHVSKGPFTMDSLFEWAIKNNLWPCPKRGDPITICEHWETKLQKAIDNASNS